MNLFFFVSYRISMFFLLVYLMFFTNLKFRRVKSIGICSLCFLISTLIDYVGIFCLEGNARFLGMTLSTFIVVQLTELFLSKTKTFRSVFIAFCGSDYTLPGGILSQFSYQYTGDIFASALVEIVAHVIILIISVKLIASQFKKSDDNDNGWEFLCLVPFIFYLAVTAFTVWPVNIIEDSKGLPGVLLLFILMILAFAASVRFTSKKHSKHFQDMNLVFLAEYSDRLRTESEKVNMMSSRMEEMSCAMQTVTSEIIELLDAGKYDDIRTIANTLKSDSRVTIEERICANRSLNAVILEVNQYAKRAGVEITYNMNVPESIGSVEFEYAVVCERLLENAVKGCSKIGARKMDVSMYTSGAWLNFEIKVKSENPSLISEENLLDVRKVQRIVIEKVESSLVVPELEAFLQKYGVRRNLRFQMGTMISEFNVRIN